MGMIYKKVFRVSVLFCATVLAIYLVTRDAILDAKSFCWSMRNDTGNASSPETQETKIIYDNSFVKGFEKTFLNKMKDKFTKDADIFQTNKTPSNKTFREIYKLGKEEKFTPLGIYNHDIKFFHNLPMLIHFIWINNDIRTRNNYDKKIEENLKTFSIYERTGWKMILWDNRKVYNIHCINKNRNQELCGILTNVTLAKQYNITLSMKSDMLRFVIIHEFGGMYFDTDFIALRNMDSIIRNKIKAHGLIVAQEGNKRRSMYLAGGFFAAYPGNICIENAKNHVVAAIKGKEPSNKRTGPYFFKRALVSTYFDTFNIDSVSIKKFNLSKVATVLPTKYFYSFPFKRKNDMTLLKKVKKLPDTYFIHLWRGSWLENINK